MLKALGWKGTNRLKALCGGEALSAELARFLTQHTASAWNMYGPTETTIWSSVRKLTPHDLATSIGKPIANTQYYLLRCGSTSRTHWRSGRAVHRRRSTVARLLESARTNGGEICTPSVPSRSAGSSVPDGRLVPLDAGRQPGVPGPARPSGQGPWLPHRAGRNRSGSRRNARCSASGGAGARIGVGHKRLVAYLVWESEL